MMFRRELAELIVAGAKTQTRRALSDNPRSPWWRERCRYQPGARFTINPGRGVTRIGEAVVSVTDKVRLGDITHADAVAEGFADGWEFREAWEAINGSWEPEQLVWRITFAVLSAGAA